MKNALYCILFGIFAAIISCSAIRATNGNIKIQKQDTTTKYDHLTPPGVPAMIIKSEEPGKRNYRPFKDSVINGLISIKKSIDLSNRKIDTGLHRQTNYIQSQNEAYNKLVQLQLQVQSLKLDTSRLYKSSAVSKDVKQDAVFGNTFKAFSVYILLFIAVGIVSIIVIVLYVHSNLSSHIKRISKSHGT